MVACFLVFSGLGRSPICPYGEAKVLKETIQNNLRFPGQYFDPETALHYNWNRYYSPKTGRYTTADPIGLDGGMNVYAYAGGNPVNAVDVEGLTAEVISIPVFTINPQTITTPILAIPQISIPATIISVVFYPTELADGTIPPGMFNEEQCDEPGPNHPYNPGKPTEKDGFEPPKNGNGEKTKKMGNGGGPTKMETTGFLQIQAMLMEVHTGMFRSLEVVISTYILVEL